MTREDLALKLKEIIVNAANLEDIEPGSIKDDTLLFQPVEEGGLGLDSLDAIQIAMEIFENLGVDIPQDEEGRKVMQSVNTLVEFIYPRLQK